ncbi:N-(5'-phosphoribosyl)anthranilate isomerase [Yoonia sp.]|uniref:N-(5'-phosphoribosyl)anthranilate isomerase n=1 Tax=Yoonia sp. TaxID=2212373 RepID=UPI002FD949E4
MSTAIPPQSPEAWFRHLFNAQAARDGGVVRRKTRDMERMVGRKLFAAEIARRGFTAVENADQVLVFCNREPLRQIAGEPISREKLASNPRRGFD